MREYMQLDREVHARQEEASVPSSIAARVQNGFGRKGWKKRNLRTTTAERAELVEIAVGRKRKLDGSFRKSRITAWNLYNGEQFQGRQMSTAAFGNAVSTLGHDWRFHVSQRERDRLQVLVVLPMDSLSTLNALCLECFGCFDIRPFLNAQAEAGVCFLCFECFECVGCFVLDF
jgi:hypothetical protein